MPDTHDPGLYDLFVSYSTKDNVAPPGEREGWVQVFIQRIRALAVQFTEKDISTTDQRESDWNHFYAPDEIHAGQLWEPRLRSAVAQTRVLLACLSEHYWQSKWCRIEWETYLQQESARGLANLEGGITPIYIATAPGVGAREIVAAAPDWARHLIESRQVRLLEFQTHGLNAIARIRALHDDPVTLDGLGKIAARVSQQIAYARRAESAKWEGNIAGGTDTFVGRGTELGKIETQLFKRGALGVITALRGLGGQGKTALALRYGQNLRTRYSGGCWQVIAEGRNELLPLLATLREPLGLGTIATETETDTAHRVLAELHRRAFDPAFPRDAGHAGAALLVVDNVDDPRLLAATQREALRAGMTAAGSGGTGWLHVLATTRLEKRDLSFLDDEHLIAVDALPEADALVLWQRILAGEGGTLPPAELDAARAIFTELERHTLAIEVAARYIRLHRDDGDTSVTYFTRLRAALATGPGRFAGDLSSQQREEQARDLLPGYTHALESTLRFTFDRLAQDHPAAATVLHYAAHFPAEAVPMPWLRRLAGRHHSELLEPDYPAIPGEWQKAALRLTESLRLLTHTDAATPEVARLHRLAAGFLRHSDQHAGEDAARLTAVEEFIDQRCRLAEADHRAQLAPWERSVLLADLTVRMVGKEATVDMARAAMLLGRTLTSYADLATARCLYLAANGVIQRLAASDPVNAEWQRDLSVSLNQLGEVAMAQGDLAGALRYFTQRLTIAERLATSDPANAKWQCDLSISLLKLGELAAEQGDLAGALRCFTESKTIDERLAASDPANAAWQWGLWISHGKLGDLATAQGDIPSALRFWIKSNDITSRLAASDPTNAEWQRALSVSLEKLGDVAVAQGDLAGALRYFTQRLTIAERLAASDPANAGWQRDLHVSLNKLGDLNAAQGDLAGALRYFTESKVIAERLAANDPANAVWQDGLAVSHSKLFQFAQKSGDEAMMQAERRATFAVLNGMKRRGMHLDPQAAQLYEQLAGLLNQ